MRAMRIPIDFVGGTSMGAIIALACAIHLSRDQMLEIMEKGCAQSLKSDYTIPIVSLLTGKKVAHSIGHYVGDCDIEDRWLPYFAISASLVHASRDWRFGALNRPCVPRTLNCPTGASRFCLDFCTAISV
jgi:NTE family protein